MTLEAQVETLDGLDDSVAGLYVETDGVFTLDVRPTNGFELANTGSLRSALETERSTGATAAKSLKALQTQFKDLDPEAARAALLRIEELGDDADVEKKVATLVAQRQQQLETQFETQAGKLRGDLEKDRDVYKTEAESLESQLGEVMVRNEALTAITAEGGAPELLLPLIVSQVEMRKGEDGKRKVVIVDPISNNVRLSVASGSTDNMSIAEYVKELKSNETYGRAFDATDASGGGSTGGGSQQNSGNAVYISSADALDVPKYRAARAEAEKRGVPLIER